MRSLLKVFAYLLSFVFARGSLFFAPILLANLLTPTDYGSLEFAQAIASTGVQFLALGTGSLVPMVLVRKLQSISWHAILLHHTVVALLFAVCGLIGVFAGYSFATCLAMFALAILLLQTLWSITLKSRGYAEASLVMDAGFWGLFAIVVSLAYAFSIPVAERWHWGIGAVGVYLLALLAWTLWHLMQSQKSAEGLMYAATVRAGLPLMLSSVLASLATTSGRLAIGFFATPEMLASYAILFRATALPIVAHQILIVARFRKTFEMPEDELERGMRMIVGLVMAGVVLFWLLNDLVGVLLGSAFASTFVHYRTEGLLILSQSVLWSAISLNDLINTRYQTATQVNRITLRYFLLVFPLIGWFLSSRPVALDTFIPLHSLVLAGYYVAQSWAMKNNNIRLEKTWIFALAGFVVLSFLSFMAK